LSLLINPDLVDPFTAPDDSILQLDSMAEPLVYDTKPMEPLINCDASHSPIAFASVGRCYVASPADTTPTSTPVRLRRVGIRLLASPPQLSHNQRFQRSLVLPRAVYDNCNLLRLLEGIITRVP
jgi:hypothetical protein